MQRMVKRIRITKGAWLSAGENDRADAAERFAGLGRAVAAISALKVTRAALSVGQLALVTHALGLENFGIYATLLSMIALLSLPASKGAARLPEREIAAAIGSGTTRDAVASVVYSMKIGPLLSIGGAVILSIAVALHPFFGVSALLVMILAAVILIFECFTKLIVGVLRGLGYTVAGAVNMNFQMILLFIATAFLFATGRLTIPNLLIARVAVGGAAFVGMALFLAVRIPGEWWSIVDRRPAKKWSSDVFDFFWVGVTQVGFMEVAVIILSLISAPSAAALFRVAARVTAFSRLVPQSAVQALHPRLAYHYRANRLQIVESQARKVAALSSLSSLLVFIAIALAGPFLFEVLFGVAFVEAFAATMILLVGQIVVSISVPNMALLMISNNSRIALRYSTLSLIVSVALAVPLSAAMGATGAAIAVALGFTLGAFLRFRFAQSVLKLHTAPTWRDAWIVVQQVSTKTVRLLRS